MELSDEEKLKLQLLQGEKILITIDQMKKGIPPLHANIVKKEIKCILLKSDTDSIEFDTSMLD